MQLSYTGGQPFSSHSVLSHPWVLQFLWRLASTTNQLSQWLWVVGVNILQTSWRIKGWEPVLCTDWSLLSMGTGPSATLMVPNLNMGYFALKGWTLLLSYDKERFGEKAVLRESCPCWILLSAFSGWKRDKRYCKEKRRRGRKQKQKVREVIRNLCPLQLLLKYIFFMIQVEQSSRPSGGQ